MHILLNSSFLLHKLLISCTVFFGSDNGRSFGGNNEDGRNPYTKIWFLTAERGKYGRMYIGYNNKICQAGLNEKGLFFDTTSAPGYEIPELDGHSTYRGDLITQAMENCKDVAEVIALFKKHGPFIDKHLPVPTVYGIIIFGDSSGDAMILEGGR